MRKAVVYIFIIAAIAVVAVVYYNSLRFKPLVDLPEVDAGEPFSRWPGIVVTCMPDGSVLIDGEPAGANAAKALEEELKTLEPRFSHLREKLPQSGCETKINLVPVLLCMDKNATTDVFLKILEILCRAYCGNIHIAFANAKGYSGLSLCILCLSGSGFYFWHDEPYKLKRETVEVRATVGEKGEWYFYCHCVPIVRGRPAILLEEEMVITKTISGEVIKRRVDKPPPGYDTVEPMFDQIKKVKEKVKEQDVIVLLDLNQYSKSLTWDWLVKLLTRLEKTKIRGYVFAAPEIPY